MWYRMQGYLEQELPYLLEENMVDGTVESILSEDSMYYQGLKWYNSAYKRGLIDPDSISNDRATQKPKVDNGYAITPSGYLPGWANTYMPYYVPGTKIYYNYTNTYGDSNYVIGINAKTENLEACLNFIDMLADPDAYLWIRSGPAGEIWDVDENGVLKLDELKKAIRPTTILISVMFANNEIGTIQPIKEIGAIAKEHGILFHTDAVQAYAQIPINVDEYNIDMLSVSGHKFGGPKGIGFLYIRKGLKLRSFIHGGAQERKRRAGTENITGIVGIAKAVEIAFATMDERIKHETEVRDYAIKRILAEVPYCRLNGDAQKRVPNNINISFQFIEGESLLIMLDMAGICASSGSACTSGSLDPSHVLLAIGLPHEIAHGSLRMTIGEETTKEDMDYVVDNIKEIVTKLRTMSPCLLYTSPSPRDS